MPFDRGGHSAAGGSFSILRFAEPELPDIVYIEQLTGALYLDRPTRLDHYREVMNSLSAEAETPAESDGSSRDSSRRSSGAHDRAAWRVANRDDNLL